MTGTKIIEIARKYLGNNGKKFCADYGIPWGSHWCCAFVWDIFRIAGASPLFYGGQRTAYVPTAQMWLHANCEHVKMSNARAGDIVVFTWNGEGYNREQGSRDHIGFVRKAGTSYTVYTLEGNTGASTPTASTVMERTRDARYIFAIYRPNYKAQKAVLTKKNSNTTNKASAAKKSKEQTKNKAEQGVKVVKINVTYKVVSPIGMNVRKKANQSSKRVGGIGYGRYVRATKKCGDWVYVKYGKISGWIRTKAGSNVYLNKVK